MKTSFKVITKESLQTQWIHKMKQNLVIVMSDDLDSLISSCLYSYLTGYPIGYFYDFKSLSAINPNDTRERVYIDIAVRSGKSIDNHVQRFAPNSTVNLEAVNFNSIYGISRYNYYQKYAMSTLIILYAIFKDEFPLPKSERGKMLILTIDSGYLGFYNDRYKESFIRNLRTLGLDELLEVLERHPLQEFNHMKECLDRKIGKKIERCFIGGELSFTSLEEKQKEIDNYLQTISDALGFPISLPTGVFDVVQEFSYQTYKADEMKDLADNERIFSYAMTGYNEIKASLMYSKDVKHKTVA